MGGDGVVVVRVVVAGVDVDDPSRTARISQDTEETKLSAACW